MIPDGAACCGQVYLWTGKWKFKVMDRKEVERQAVAIRMTALDAGKQHRENAEAGPGRGASVTQLQDVSTLHDLENGALGPDERRQGRPTLNIPPCQDTMSSL
jgi:hypothetical protein